MFGVFQEKKLFDTTGRIGVEDFELVSDSAPIQAVIQVRRLRRADD